MTTPPLPEPWREDADGEPHYTIVQVIEYGQQCRAAALEEVARPALDALESIPTSFGNVAYTKDVQAAIRALKAVL